MTALGYYIVLGDLLVSGMLVGIAIWLFTRVDDDKIDAAARIPLEEPPAQREGQGD